MPFPIVGAVGAAAAGAAGGVASGFLTAPFEGLLGTFKWWIGSGSWAVRPALPPAGNDLLTAHRHARIVKRIYDRLRNDEDARRVLERTRERLDEKLITTLATWSGVALVPPNELPYAIWSFPFSTESTTREAIEMAARGWDAAWESARTKPSVDAVIGAWVRGAITDSERDAYLALAGVDPDEWQKLFVAHLARLTPFELVRLKFLGIIDEQTFSDMMRKAGVSADLHRDVLRWYEWNVRGFPGPSDLVAFSVREVFDADTVKEFGYDREFPEEFEHFMRAQGWAWNLGELPGTPASMHGITWPRAYWRAHWRMISPEQAYEMFHRLRPDRVRHFAVGDRVPEPFTIDHVRRVLKIADYPEPLRDRLAAIAYRLPTRVDVRRMRQLGIITRDEVREAYLDLGYTPTDAGRLTEFVERQNELARSRPLVRSLMRAYAVGTITRAELVQQLAGIFGDLSLAERAAQAAEADANERVVRVQIAGVRRRYLVGDITRAQAEGELIGIGIVSEARRRYLAMWDAELDARSRQVTAATIIDWYVHGIISERDAAAKLANLGYDDEDIRRMLVRARLRVFERLLRDLARQLRARTIEPKVRRAQAGREHLSRSLLERFVKHGVISIPAAAQELREMGWSEEEVALWVADMTREEEE